MAVWPLVWTTTSLTLTPVNQLRMSSWTRYGEGGGWEGGWCGVVVVVVVGGGGGGSSSGCCGADGEGSCSGNADGGADRGGADDAGRGSPSLL